MELAVAAIAAVATVAAVVVGLGLVVIFAPRMRSALVRAAGAVHAFTCDLFGGGFVTGAAVTERRELARRSELVPGPAGVGRGPSVNQGSTDRSP